MRVPRVATWAVAVLVGMTSVSRAQSSAEAGEEWKLVDSLPIDRTAVPWQPSIALHRDTVYVASNLVSESDGKPLPDRPLVLYRRPGAPLPLPPGNFTFAFPHGVVDPQGAYHLFWGEGSDSINRPYPGPNHNVSALWHAVFEAGAWTSPERVLSARRISWAGEPSSVTWDSRGRLHVAAPASDTNWKYGVLHARRDPGGWRVRDIPEMVAAYVTLLPGGVDTMSIVVSGGYSAFPSRLPDFQRNRLAILHSFDGGGSWSDPRLLDGLTQLEAYDVRGSVAEGGAIHLLWKGASDSGDSRVEGFVSRDRGRSWSATESFEVDGMLSLHHLAVGRCGAHFVGSVAGEKYTTLLSRPAVSSRHLNGRISVQSPALAVVGENVAISVLAFGPTEDDMSWLILKRSGC